MKVRKGFASIAVAVLALGSAAWADDISSVRISTHDSVQTAQQMDLVKPPLLADDTTSAPAPAAPADTLLMSGLGKIGLEKPLQDAGISITGFAEIGYFYDTTVPNRVSPQRTFGDYIVFPGAYKNSFIIDQIDLDIAKTVNVTDNLQKGKWDFGFNVEGIFGRDALFTHSNGILDQNNKHGGGPDNQLDLVQANFSIGIPLGNGLVIQAGKFVTLMGQETINPTLNQFYTHTYEFSFGIPFTQTGVLATYYLTPDQTMWATAGFTRGWNQSTDDNNGAIDFLGQFGWKPADSKWSIIGNLSVGPEFAKDCSNYWVVPEAIVSYKLSDQLSLSGDFLYGYANAAGQWYGAAGYAGYVVSDYVTVNGRLEWYNDNGITTGFGTYNNYYEATLGVGVTPIPHNDILKNLVIRPEVRYDWSNHAAYEGQFSELTVAVDAYFKF